MAYAIAEFTVLAAVLLWALWQFAGHATPQLRASVQAALAQWLMQAGRARWQRRLGLRLLPQVAQHCGDGCSRCGVCGPLAPDSR